MDRLAASPVVVITGAAAGIGRALARRYARAGYRIGLIARDEAALAVVKRELEATTEVEAAPADVADAEAVFAAADQLGRRLGPCDVWINDAMETIFSRFVDMTSQEFRRVTEVTYLGFVHGTIAALKSMRPRGRGRIVQVSSALAYRGIPLQSAYCGAKHAIRGFTDALRAELIAEDSKIRVTIVDLPAVNTPQFDWARAHLPRSPRPMGRPVQPEAVADAIFRAAQGDWREYWIGGPTLLTILANTIAPGLLDRYLARTGIEGQQTSTPLESSRQDNLESPVTTLHSVRGSFSAEASDRTMLVPGELARLAIVAAGAAAFIGLGALVGRRIDNRSGSPRPTRMVDVQPPRRRIRGA